MKKYGDPGWFSEWVVEVRASIAKRKEYELADNEAYAVLKQSGRDVGYGPTRWKLWRAANHVKDRDFVESARLDEEIFLSVLMRQINHARVCDCGAKV